MTFSTSKQRRRISATPLLIMIITPVLVQKEVHQKTNYYANSKCYRSTTDHQKNLLIWTLADFSLLLYIIQQLSFRKCDYFFIGLNIIIFFYLFNLKGKVQRDCPNHDAKRLLHTYLG